MDSASTGHQVWVTQANLLSVVAGNLGFTRTGAAETGAVGEGRWVAEAAWYQLSDHTFSPLEDGRRIHADRSTSNKFPYLYATTFWTSTPPKPWSSTLLKG